MCGVINFFFALCMECRENARGGSFHWRVGLKTKATVRYCRAGAGGNIILESIIKVTN